MCTAMFFCSCGALTRILSYICTDNVNFLTFVFAVTNKLFHHKHTMRILSFKVFYVLHMLQAYLKRRIESTMGVSLVEAIVTLVEPVGMGDRVCVDLCNLLNPGEGLLVSHFFLERNFSSPFGDWHWVFNVYMGHILRATPMIIVKWLSQ